MKTTTRAAGALAAGSALTMAAVLAMGGVGSAAAVLQVTPSPVAPGGTITITGDTDCVTPGTAMVNLVLPNHYLFKTVDVGSELGPTWTTDLAIPADAPAGNYQITISQGECINGESGSFTISAGETTSSTTTTASSTTTTSAPAQVKAATATAATPAFTG